MLASCVQIAGLLASLVVLLVIVAIGFVFQPLPQVCQSSEAHSEDVQLAVTVQQQHIYDLLHLLSKQLL